MLEGTVHERRVTAQCAGRSIGHIPIAHGTVEDVGVGRRDGAKYGGIEAKVLGKNVFRCVGDPVIYHEGGSVLDELLATPVWSLVESKTLTRLYQSPPRRTQVGTHSRHPAPGRCGQLPWGNTRYRHN